MSVQQQQEHCSAERHPHPSDYQPVPPMHTCLIIQLWWNCSLIVLFTDCLLSTSSY